MMPRIYTGADADDAFGNLVRRDPDEMRAQNERAFIAIKELLTAQRAMLTELFNRGKQ